MLRLLALLLLSASVAQAQTIDPAPPLRFEAGTVLAGGHVLQSAVTLPATSGPVSLAVQGGRLDWSIRVENGETRLLDGAGRWVAKAEYHRLMRDGSAVCQIYQTTISPEWALQGGDRPGRADFSPADDRIYSFRDVPCP
jgi:hypothetical protein